MFYKVTVTVLISSLNSKHWLIKLNVVFLGTVLLWHSPAIRTAAETPPVPLACCAPPHARSASSWAFSPPQVRRAGGARPGSRTEGAHKVPDKDRSGFKGSMARLLPQVRWLLLYGVPSVDKHLGMPVPSNHCKIRHLKQRMCDLRPIRLH